MGYFVELYKMIQTADIQQIVSDTTLALIDNMQYLTDDHWLYGHKGGMGYNLEYAKKTQKSEIKSAALSNVMGKYFRKIRTVVYIIDKFVRYEKSVETKKKIFDSIKADTLNELKKESWKDALRAQVGGAANLAKDPLTGVMTIVTQQDTAANKAQRMFGRLSTLTDALYNARATDRFTQAGSVAGLLNAAMQSGPMKASK